MSNIQAVILAAGKGSRLHPLTVQRSKAMLPILGKPILERVMDNIDTLNVKSFIVVVNPEDREIIDYLLEKSEFRAKIIIVHQPDRMGMADALKFAEKRITGDFILSACDNLISKEHIENLWTCWNTNPKCDAVLSLMRGKPENLHRAGVVCMNAGQITRIIEKPPPGNAPSNIISLPLYVFSTKVLSYLHKIPLSPRGEYELQDAIQMLIDNGGKVRGVYTNWRLTLTSPSDLLAINRTLLSNTHPPVLVHPSSIGKDTTIIEPVYIESNVHIGKGCTIGPNVYIEAGCIINDGVSILNSVLLKGCTIPSCARIENKVVS